MASIEINGKTIETQTGKMIIEVADEAGIYIPRFCYHKKLSVAANCRMCLVEIENGRKPVPACATPVTNGMKVYTESKLAVDSQKAVMEFLLINHPLDCPICDQGGECDLQDLSLEYGSSHSEYESTKRAVSNDNLGPLIATEMTRCIHCTRCVRFMDEVAGLRELGAIGRGEDMEISSCIKHSVASEVSGNIIDLCPVGALTSKPFRFKARAWEMREYESIAPHDSLGSNIKLHVLNNKLMRVVPKECEAINEVWLSDRDRFSYLGLQSKARVTKPMLKRDGEWIEVDWKVALNYVKESIAKIIKQYGAQEFAAFASSSSTLEESYLLQKWMRNLGVNNLDHRIREVDFRDDNNASIMPIGNLPYAQIENQNTIFLVGLNIMREVPLAGGRVRKAFKNGAKIYALNPIASDCPFDIAENILASPQDMVLELAKIVAYFKEQISDLKLSNLLENIKIDDKSKKIAKALCNNSAVILTGAIFETHPERAILRSLIYALEKYSKARLVRFTMGANAAGNWLAGMLPHRAAAGEKVLQKGLDVHEALKAKLKGYLLLGIEPEFDMANPLLARQSLLAAESVIMISAYQNDSMRDYADVILPFAPFAETSGTYINLDGTIQSFTGAMAPYGEARPAWKILRVLGNFNYASSADVLLEIKQNIEFMHVKNYEAYYPDELNFNKSQNNLMRVGEWPLYRVDSIVRNAEALQIRAGGDKVCVRMHPKIAANLKLQETVTISQGEIEITLPLELDESVAEDAIWVPHAMPETVDLGFAADNIVVKN